MASIMSIVFSVLNWIAFSGWSFITYRLFFLFTPWNNGGMAIDDLRMPVLALEGICILEIARILVGDLKGNFVLGVVLHAIRLVTMLETMVRLPNHWTGVTILASWAITEVFRYPMYMFPSNQFCRSIRMVIPLATFPVGAFSEAYGASVVLFDPETPIGLKIALAAVLFVNGVLGPTMAYPALLKKGLPILGFAETSKRKNKKLA